MNISGNYCRRMREIGQGVEAVERRQVDMQRLNDWIFNDNILFDNNV